MGPCGLPAMLPAGAARQTPTSGRSPAWRAHLRDLLIRESKDSEPQLLKMF